MRLFFFFPFPGKLIMNLTKDTYERLGLEGKKSQFHSIRNDRYGKENLKHF